MKHYLVLDSSNKDLVVGLINNNKEVDLIKYSAFQKHSENMVPEIKKIILRNNIDYKNIDGVIVNVGPGSYTGIRIALTIAKIMALAIGCKLFKVSSLHSLAIFNKKSICLINARSNRSYFGVYSKEKVLIEDKVISNEEALKYIKEHKDYIVCGDAEYLGLKSLNNKSLEQYVNLLPYLKEEENPLYLKPVYLKENYETKF